MNNSSEGFTVMDEDDLAAAKVLIEMANNSKVQTQENPGQTDYERWVKNSLEVTRISSLQPPLSTPRHNNSMEMTRAEVPSQPEMPNLQDIPSSTQAQTSNDSRFPALQTQSWTNPCSSSDEEGQLTIVEESPEVQPQKTPLQPVQNAVMSSHFQSSFTHGHSSGQDISHKQHDLVIPPDATKSNFSSSNVANTSSNNSEDFMNKMLALVETLNNKLKKSMAGNFEKVICPYCDSDVINYPCHVKRHLSTHFYKDLARKYYPIDYNPSAFKVCCICFQVFSNHLDCLRHLATKHDGLEGILPGVLHSALKSFSQTQKSVPQMQNHCAKRDKKCEVNRVNQGKFDSDINEIVTKFDATEDAYNDHYLNEG